MNPEGYLLVPVALLLALGFVRLAIQLAPKLGLIDTPGERRIHTKAVPRAGGIGIWIAFVITLTLGHAFGLISLTEAGGFSWLIAFLAASALILLVGVIDDRFGLSPLMKLGGQIVAVSLLFFMRGDQMGSLLGFEIPWYVDLAIWVAWSVAIINAFNLIDGMDGLCGGLGLIACITIAAICFLSGQPNNGMVILVMAAVLVGFLRYNFYPAKIFLGDAGSMFIGLFVATVSSASVGERVGITALLIPLLVAGIPLFDVILAVWRRTARKWLSSYFKQDASKVFSADKDHLHHRLLDLGFNQRKVAGLLYAAAVLLAVFAILPSFFEERALGVTVVAFGVCGMIGLRYAAPIELQVSGDVLHFALKRPPASKLISFGFFAYDLCIILLATTVAYLIEFQDNFAWLTSRQTLTTVAITLACAVIALRMSKAHARHWGRTSLKDVASISLWFAIALMGAFSITALIEFDLAWRSVRIFMMTGVVGLALLLVPRLFAPLLRESAIDSQHRHLGRSRGERERIVIYGAGDLGELFLHHLRTSRPTEFNEKRIIGFIDDHPNLLGRYIDGFRIYGSVEKLKYLKEKYDLKGILVVASRIDPENASKLNELSQELGLHVYRWRPQLQIISVHEPDSEEAAEVVKSKLSRF